MKTTPMRLWGRRGIWAHKNTAKKLEALEPLEVKRIDAAAMSLPQVRQCENSA